MRTINNLKNLLIHYKKLKETIESILRIEKEIPPNYRNEESIRAYTLELRIVKYKIQKTKKRLEEFIV